MNKKNKILIILLIIIILLFVGVIIIKVANTSKNTTTSTVDKENNISNNIIKIDKLNIKLLEVSNNGDNNYIKLNITSKYKEDKFINTIKLILKDKDDKVVKELYYIYENNIKPNESSDIIIYTEENLNNVSKINYELVE